MHILRYEIVVFGMKWWIKAHLMDQRKFQAVGDVKL